MSEREPRKKYSGEFKQMVVETMRNEHLSHREAARRFELTGKGMVATWERIYLEEGAEGLYRQRQGRPSATGDTPRNRKPSLNKKVEEDLIAENQRLRAENDYLKKLRALVLEEERQSKGRK